MKAILRTLFYTLLSLAYIAFLIWVTYSVLKGTLPFYFIFLSLAMLARLPDIVTAQSRYATEDDRYSISLSLRLPAGKVTPEHIAGLLDNEEVLRIIRNDLRKTDQIGYREEWRLGLITPDLDWVDPDLAGKISLRRTAIVHSTDYFKPNNIVVFNGAVKPLGLSKWSSGLETKLNRGEFIGLRNIRVEEAARLTPHGSQSLPEFLREDGFPLKATYPDGDPLTTIRSGTIVLDRGRVAVIYPHYFMQRRLIDDAGNLVDLGIDEDMSRGSTFDVLMQPPRSMGLIQRVSGKRNIPVLRYRSCPYASDYLLPILDTPICCNGWADLFIAPAGKAKLFIAREKTDGEWQEMMNRLRQLLSGELAKECGHLLELTKDRVRLDLYLAKKQTILEDYFSIRDCRLM